jgi:parvulin-like peptidyl-prolyl isomerase
MSAIQRLCGVLVLGLVCLPASAQTGNAPPAAAGVAATVNGEPIPEKAIQRGLQRLPPDRQAEARIRILDYLVDNVLVDQHLVQLGVEVPRGDVDSRIQQVRDEIKKEGQTFEKVMEKLGISEEELRVQMTAELRWEKYCTAQATDKVLREVFDKNPEMFDGTMVRARHILLTPKAGDAQAVEQAKQSLRKFKQQCEEAAAAAVAKVPADADAQTREKARVRALEDAFADTAREESACPSRAQGGDLSWFPRTGSMVEPFAGAAFALKRNQMSDVVETSFGYHLILVTDRRQGKETKFEDVKDVVKEAYCDRLRETLCADLRPKAKIVITPVAKP